jgi:uncharacterized protein YbaR (Trm112 family)
MPSNLRKPISFDSSVIESLACPACQGSLALGEDKLICRACGRAYPVVNGIPILIADRAVSPANSNILSN